MTDFLNKLSSSIFTPGATPTLLLATNATFGCLQLVLAALLFATSSVHFAILSVLCAGLWWSINWFATELSAAQAREEEAERQRQSQGQGKQRWKETGEVGDSADDEGGEGTETETEGEMRESVDDVDGKGSVVGRGTEGVGGSSTGMEKESAQAVRLRQMQEGDRSGDQGDISSTDSEWDKVDDV